MNGILIVDELDVKTELFQVIQSLMKKLKFLGYLSMIGGVLAILGGMVFATLLLPAMILIPVSGVLLVRSSVAFRHCAIEDDTATLVSSLRSLNAYFTMQIIFTLLIAALPVIFLAITFTFSR